MAYVTLGSHSSPAGADFIRPRVEIHDGYGVREQLKAAGWKWDSYDKVWHKTAQDRYDFLELAGWMREAQAMGVQWWVWVDNMSIGLFGAARNVQDKAQATKLYVEHQAVINAQRLGEREERWDAALTAFRGMELYVSADAWGRQCDPQRVEL